MRILVIIVACSFQSLSAFASAPPIQCKVTEIHGKPRVLVSVKTPHPTEMLIQRPGGETIWLRVPGLPHQFPDSNDFANLGVFSITADSLGVIFNEDDGRPNLVPILKEDGVYWLLIAENAETELENTYFLDCKFTIRENDA